MAAQYSVIDQFLETLHPGTLRTKDVKDFQAAYDALLNGEKNNPQAFFEKAFKPTGDNSQGWTEMMEFTHCDDLTVGLFDRFLQEKYNCTMDAFKRGNHGSAIYSLTLLRVAVRFQEMTDFSMKIVQERARQGIPLSSDDEKLISAIKTYLSHLIPSSLVYDEFLQYQVDITQKMDALTTQEDREKYIKFYTPFWSCIRDPKYTQSHAITAAEDITARLIKPKQSNPQSQLVMEIIDETTGATVSWHVRSNHHTSFMTFLGESVLSLEYTLEGKTHGGFQALGKMDTKSFEKFLTYLKQGKKESDKRKKQSMHSEELAYNVMYFGHKDDGNFGVKETFLGTTGISLDGFVMDDKPYTIQMPLDAWRILMGGLKDFHKKPKVFAECKQKIIEQFSSLPMEVYQFIVHNLHINDLMPLGLEEGAPSLRHILLDLICRVHLETENPEELKRIKNTFNTSLDEKWMAEIFEEQKKLKNGIKTPNKKRKRKKKKKKIAIFDQFASLGGFSSIVQRDPKYFMDIFNTLDPSEEKPMETFFNKVFNPIEGDDPGISTLEVFYFSSDQCIASLRAFFEEHFQSTFDFLYARLPNNPKEYSFLAHRAYYRLAALMAVKTRSEKQQRPHNIPDDVLASLCENATIFDQLACLLADDLSSGTQDQREMRFYDFVSLWSKVKHPDDPAVTLAQAVSSKINGYDEKNSKQFKLSGDGWSLTWFCKLPRLTPEEAKDLQPNDIFYKNIAHVIQSMTYSKEGVEKYTHFDALVHLDHPEYVQFVQETAKYFADAFISNKGPKQVNQMIQNVKLPLTLFQTKANSTDFQDWEILFGREEPSVPGRINAVFTMAQWRFLYGDSKVFEGQKQITKAANDIIDRCVALGPQTYVFFINIMDIDDRHCILQGTQTSLRKKVLEKMYFSYGQILDQKKTFSDLPSFFTTSQDKKWLSEFAKVQRDIALLENAKKPSHATKKKKEKNKESKVHKDQEIHQINAVEQTKESPSHGDSLETPCAKEPIPKESVLDKPQEIGAMDDHGFTLVKSKKRDKKTQTPPKKPDTAKAKEVECPIKPITPERPTQAPQPTMHPETKETAGDGKRNGRTFMQVLLNKDHQTKEQPQEEPTRAKTPEAPPLSLGSTKPQANKTNDDQAKTPQAMEEQETSTNQEPQETAIHQETPEPSAHGDFMESAPVIHDDHVLQPLPAPVQNVLETLYPNQTGYETIDFNALVHYIMWVDGALATSAAIAEQNRELAHYHMIRYEEKLKEEYFHNQNMAQMANLLSAADEENEQLKKEIAQLKRQGNR